MKKKIAILSSVFLLSLIYLTPAKLIENLVEMPNNVNLSGFSGSIWSGSIGQVATQDLSWSDVEYSINPLALALAELSVNLVLPVGDVKGEVDLLIDSNYANSLKVANADLTLPANLLEKYVPVRDVKINGNISTQALHANLANKKLTLLDGQINWQGARISYSGSEWIFGDFSFALSTDEKTNTITANILKSKNELDLQGVATLTADGMLEFVGSISTEVKQQPVYNAISMFKSGNAEGGRLPIKYRQKVL